MIGETTLAMLYVPLLFYIFDRWAERGKEGKATPEARDKSPPGGTTPAAHAPQEGD